MNEILKNIGLIYNKESVKSANALDEAVLCFKKHDLNAKPMTTDDIESDISLAVVLGGDGSILKTARYCSRFDIPIVGINLGRLGFLSQAKLSELDKTIESINSGDYRIDERLMLKTINNICALNDIVIRGNTFSRTSRLCVQINDQSVCDYLADGIIIATPTGSTAYTLSAGGPVVEPSLEAMVIIPICPHTMTARPLVVPAKEKITILTTEKTRLRITADGQKSLTVPSSTKIDIFENDKKAKLLLLNSNKGSFYSILREKLYWGMSWKG
ncbi:NAD(+)/NADH kinase [bacterium]|nr:NAD(+)/NADH kinase [bacterium]